MNEIWTKLEELGFASNCIVFGVGAFCFTATFEDERMVVQTRDTFGIAMKASYGIIDGRKLFIFKDPKTDTDNLKKSHKGCCKVYEEDGMLKCQDQFMDMVDEKDTLLKTVYMDGKLVKETDFMEIRKRMEDK